MNEIQAWINNPNRQYEEGIAIFALYSKNRALVRYFQTGTARFRMGKLEYEMGKLAKTVPAGEMSKTRPNIKSFETSLISSVHTMQNDSVRSNCPKSVQDIPDFILAAKKEIASLYSLIDRRHQELYELGTGNAGDVVRKRKAILDGRKPAIERADRLYQLKEEWFALNDSPARQRVANDIKQMLQAPVNEQPTITNYREKPIVNRGILSEKSDIELAKRRTQLRSSITKTQNMLQYQSIRKAATSTPMPPGPKRSGFEKKLKELKAEMMAVTEEMERRNLL